MYCDRYKDAWQQSTRRWSKKERRLYSRSAMRLSLNPIASNLSSGFNAIGDAYSSDSGTNDSQPVIPLWTVAQESAQLLHAVQMAREEDRYTLFVIPKTPIHWNWKIARQVYLQFIENTPDERYCILIVGEDMLWR